MILLNKIGEYPVICSEVRTQEKLFGKIHNLLKRCDQNLKQSSALTKQQSSQLRWSVALRESVLCKRCNTDCVNDPSHLNVTGVTNIWIVLEPCVSKKRNFTHSSGLT
jgi:hypothetical protein